MCVRGGEREKWITADQSKCKKSKDPAEGKDGDTEVIGWRRGGRN